MQDFVRRFRAKATKARQAQSRIKALERMELIAPAHIDSPFQFKIPETDKISDPLIVLDQAKLGYTHPILNNIRLSFHPGDRIGLLGPNGAGKSTLVKSLKGELPLMDGVKTDGKNLKIGYFSQHQVDDLDLDKSALRHMQDLDDKATESVIRNFLGGFNFRGNKVKDPITHFSGGEKARLALAIIAFQKPNLLLMDEPTNHLDMDMRQALTVALQEFGGAILLISHDRHLLVNTVDEFLIIEDGELNKFDGDLEDYRKSILKNKSVKLNAKDSKTSKEKQPNRIDKKEARQIRAKVATHEKTLKRLQTKLLETEEILNNPDAYLKDEGPDLQSLLRTQIGLKDQIEELEGEWLEMNTKLGL
jgi:ATP-binding cassette subfamily F protein 3